MPTIFNSTSEREEAWQNMLGAYQDLQNSRPGQAYKKASEVGGRILSRVGLKVLNYFGLELLRNKNLALRQKIIPAIGVALATTIVIPAAIASVFGLSILIPPVSIVASVASVFTNVANYIKDRTERNNLRKLLIRGETLDAQIAKTPLLDAEKNTLLNYANKQKEVYQALYEARRFIMESQDSTLSMDDKKQAILKINEAIENVQAGDNTPLMLSFPEGVSHAFREAMSLLVLKANQEILEYRSISAGYSMIPISSSLKKSIESCRAWQGAIYSQDLPVSIKRKLVELLQSSKVSKKDINEIYARIGNHYLNLTSLAQETLLERGTHINESNQIQAVANFPTPKVKPFSAITEPFPSPQPSDVVPETVKSAFATTKTRILKKLFGASGVARRKQEQKSRSLLKQERQSIEDDFTARYQSTHQLLAQKSRLDYVESSTKTRVREIVIGLATAAVSITATALMASVASPAAPAAIAGAALGVVGTVMTVGAFGAAIHLGIQESKAKDKVDKPIQTVTSAVVPGFDNGLTERRIAENRPQPTHWQPENPDNLDPHLRDRNNADPKPTPTPAFREPRRLR